ncbi:MAG: class I SAM-dependent methyltransferase [Myxococcota bacterium]|jgi:23S rRNA G2069 N7-methylase RlmK/C1962 C5-methylase RlmI|nr:class I SAM-dependent methyltransferase [Myxococcota bacterium]
MDRRFAAQAEMLANRLRKNERRLKPWRQREEVTCYRVYERDIPEIPLAIDRYESRLHVAEFARPWAPGPHQEEGWAEALAQAAAAALGVAPDAVYLKRRERMKGLRQYERQARTGERFVVREGGLGFFVNLADYLDTGLFLDHRLTRQEIRGLAAGSRFLNLYSYTGSFSVYAAAGGALSTTSVDLSATYLRWSADNLAQNGFTGPEHQFVQADVEEYLDRAAHAGARFDLVVVDPPTFSNSKRLETVFDVQRDHPGLLRAVRRVCAPGGIIYFSTNFKKFELEAEAVAGLAAAEISDRTRPPDFRDARIHRCWRIELPG